MVAFFEGNGREQSPSQRHSQESQERAALLLTKIELELATLRAGDLGDAAKTIRELEQVVAEIRIQLMGPPNG